MTRNVLSVASECAPLLKTGGLADVVGALPGALARHGWSMRVLMPAYRGLLPRLGGGTALWSGDLQGGKARIVAAEASGTRMLLLDAPHLYDREGGPYAGAKGDHPDNPQRFAALCKAARLVAEGGLSDGWQPEILHAHDWQAGLAPAYLRYAGASPVKTVMTVHNIAFQGIAGADLLGGLGLPVAEFHADALEYYGNVSALKAGLVTADAITTVSPTYASELMRPEFGMGLEGIISKRADCLHGILNGIDTSVWSPAADPEIVAYDARTLKKKAQNRARLLDEFGLGDVPGPLVVVVSRLTTQKGIDLIPEVLPEFILAGGGLVVLGSGDAGLEEAMRRAAGRFPGRVGVKIGYDEALSHRIFAGGDAVLVPSRFEPCGLTQMMGLSYGTVPVVAATGGLADTVIHANPMALAAKAATGITFHPTDATALGDALRRLVQLHGDTAQWQMVQKNGMKQPVDWNASSAAYARLYESLLSESPAA
ncbi:glycogen synthase GlgA [Anianabacter salinae]|uniref:glycogen synthase GlgA n=1 Tax=Anianabacter salinae TaxID=2851023 RepID=UPI00225DF1E6|nr:glycogen synthase GlgA [Anianabacter salinae]MBV0911760.1 glycogen synthase GlgA [Anianabacter salinae]